MGHSACFGAQIVSYKKNLIYIKLALIQIAEWGRLRLFSFIIIIMTTWNVNMGLFFRPIILR